MAFETGLRGALKDAISARDSAIDRVEASRAAVDRLEDQYYAARSRLNEVRARAGERVSERAAALIAGGDAAVMDRGRFAEQDAEAAVTACRAARDLCKRALADAENALGFAEMKVTSAVGNVISSSVEGLLAEAERLRHELEGKRAVLTVLRPMLPDELGRKIYMALPDLGLGNSGHPAVLAWQAAADALSKSADAALPQ